jgi:hypothetical protein
MTMEKRKQRLIMHMLCGISLSIFGMTTDPAILIQSY